MVDKSFKIIPKGEKFQLSLVDYVNLHFKNYITDKDINREILMENPVPSDLQGVPVQDDFVKTLII